MDRARSGSRWLYGSGKPWPRSRRYATPMATKSTRKSLEAGAGWSRSRRGITPQDIYAGLGQLMLYTKLFPRLAKHALVLLLPDIPGKALADAVADCGVSICTFEADFDVTRVQIAFSPKFLRRCGAVVPVQT